ncbi:MAG: tetratricopeptide repeat protein [Gemmataceae bacterium]|nr:tetratricopeptide repeat protein [Gemmataceae bacterium]
MKPWRLAALLGLSYPLAVCVPPAQAQVHIREISGFVRAQGMNQPPPGTILSLQLGGGGTLERVTPQGSGYFKFEALHKGVYYVVATAPGYQEASQRVEVIGTPRVSVHITLFPIVREPETVVPPADAGVVDQRQLRIPEGARKEFERGTHELFEKKSPAAAVPHFQKAIHEYAEYYEAYHLLGTAYMDQQQWPEAEEALKHSVEVNQEYAPAYTTLGALYNRQQKFAEALPLLRKAMEMDDSWQCHFELAQSLLALGEIQEAAPHAQQAHTLAPRFPLVHLVLGNIALRQQDIQQGRDEYAHFLELVPQGPLAERVRLKMQEFDRLLAQTKKEFVAP